MLKVGVALVLVSAVGYYLEPDPRFPGKMPVTAVGQGDVLRLLREPQSLSDIAFTDGEGHPKRLASYRGKVILLNLWATWCPPCRKEMPALDRLQASFGGPNFEVIALSIDRDGLSAVRAFYLHTGIKQLRVYMDKSGQAMADLGVVAIPTTLLIDRNGDEIGRKVGPAEWDSPALIKPIREHVDAPAKPTDLPSP